jgi:signal peptidase I
MQSKLLTAAFLRQAIKNNKKVKLYISGHCMDPVLKDGSSVVVTKYNELSVGDIVIIEDDTSKLLVHRIIQINDNWAVTAGDNNKVADKPTRLEEIIGIVESETHPEQEMKDRLCALDTSPLLFVNPYCLGESEIQSIKAFYSFVSFEKNPVEIKKRLKELGVECVLIHHGATKHMSELNRGMHQNKYAFFIGYNNESMFLNGSTVDECCRAGSECWHERNYVLEISYLIGALS